MSPNVSVVPKPAPIRHEDWLIVETWVRAALRRGKSIETADDYFSACQSRQRQLWHLVDQGRVTGVLISEVFDTPDGKTVGLPVTAGKNMTGSLEAVLGTIEAWARDIGAVRLEGNGRLGWTRVLKSRGWKPVCVRIEKVLT